MEISVPGVPQLPFHCANVPVCRPFLGIEKWKTLVNPMLPVGGIGASFGIVVETELETTAWTNNVCRATLLVMWRLRQTVISANRTDKFLLEHNDGLSRLV